MGDTLYPLFIDFLFCCCLGLTSPWHLGHWMWGASLDLSSASPGSVAKLLPLSPFLPFCRIVLVSARCSLVASAPAARLLELEGDSTAGGGTGPFCFLAVALRVTLAMALCLSSSGCLTSSSLHTLRTTLFVPPGSWAGLLPQRSDFQLWGVPPPAVLGNTRFSEWCPASCDYVICGPHVLLWAFSVLPSVLNSFFKWHSLSKWV